jgi:hypothetical protein
MGHYYFCYYFYLFCEQALRIMARKQGGEDHNLQGLFTEEVEVITEIIMSHYPLRIGHKRQRWIIFLIAIVTIITIMLIIL